MVEVVGLSFAALELIIDIIVRSMLGVQVDDALVPFDLRKLVRIIVRIVASSDSFLAVIDVIEQSVDRLLVIITIVRILWPLTL